MKSILISINPKWCELIANGSKTIEVRKTKPKCDVPFKCYIYCTKSKNNTDTHISFEEDNIGECINGKVIGEFVCDEIYQYSTESIDGQTIPSEEMQKQSCLTEKELCNYETSTAPQDFCIYRIGLYGWHISNLIIYDKPKELRELQFNCSGDCDTCKYSILDVFNQFDEPRYRCDNYVTRPPQSWCYVEEL